MPDNRPEMKVDRTTNHGDLVRFLKENGINNLDDLAQFALQQAQEAGTQEDIWAAITKNYVLVGPQ